MSNPVLDAYVAGIAQVADLLTYSPADLAKVPVDAGWSAAQVLGHLADAEISIALRMRMIFTTDSYHFLAWDEDEFANLNPNRNPIASVGVVTALRRANLDLIDGLSADFLTKTGTKLDGQPISVIDYLDRMNQHTLDHLAQAKTALAG
ncbi:MAG: DinB family protein [Candidatus Nanopelagicales bacterium]